MPFIRTAPMVRPIHPLLKAYLRHRGMGYVRRGMGQCYDATGAEVDCALTSSLSMPPVSSTPLPGTTDIGTNINLPGLTNTGLPITTPTTQTATPSTLTSILASIPGLLQSGVQTYNVLQGPGLVPGTQAIYNPATGQYYNPTTGQVVNPSGITTGAITADLSAYMPIILIGGGLLIAVMLLGGKR